MQHCQSCGMPMNNDPELGGTEKNGEKSAKYCSYCYENGAFLNPEIDSAKKMQNLCIEKMKEGGMSGIMACILTRFVPYLDRWKK